MTWAPACALPGLSVLLFCGPLVQAVLLAGKTHKQNSFMDHARTVCLDGPPDAVEAALATFKSSPKGRLYLDSWASPGKNCADRRYTYAPQELGCFPGVTASFKSKHGKNKYIELRAKALASYQKDFGLNNRTMGLLVTCSCDTTGPRYQKFKARCQGLNVTGSWIHKNEVTHAAYSCHEGPYEHMIRALAVMKSSRLLSFHLQDQIAVRSCKEQGFKHAMAGSTDPTAKCFPPAKGFFENPLLARQFRTDKKVVTSNRFFNKFVHDRGLDRSTLRSNPNCDCLSSSVAGGVVNRELCATIPGMQSPARKVWGV